MFLKILPGRWLPACVLAGSLAVLPAQGNAQMMGGYGMGPGMMGPGMGYGMGPGMMGGYGMGPGMMQGYGMGPGMMGGYGMGYGMGPGMMRGYGMGPGMMGGYGMGPGMMQGYGMGPGMMMGWMQDMNDEQRKKLEQIHESVRKQQWEQMGKIAEAQMNLFRAMQQETVDPKKLGEAYDAVAKLRKQMFEMMAGVHNQMMSILTPEQRARWKSWHFGEPAAAKPESPKK